MTSANYSYTAKQLVQKRYPEAVCWRAGNTRSWVVTTGVGPFARLGVARSARSAWDDAAIFVRRYGG